MLVVEGRVVPGDDAFAAEVSDGVQEFDVVGFGEFVAVALARFAGGVEVGGIEVDECVWAVVFADFFLPRGVMDFGVVAF